MHILKALLASSAVGGIAVAAGLGFAGTGQAAVAPMTLTAHQVSSPVLFPAGDLNKFVQGSYGLFDDNVVNPAGKVIGYDSGVCFLTRKLNLATHNAILSCTDAIVLPGGSIEVAGSTTANQQRTTFAVTGGTGKFLGRRGEVTAVNGPSGATKLTFTFV